jgi:hypothetical protein
MSSRAVRRLLQQTEPTLYPLSEGEEEEMVPARENQFIMLPAEDEELREHQDVNTAEDQVALFSATKKSNKSTRTGKRKPKKDKKKTKCRQQNAEDEHDHNDNDHPVNEKQKQLDTEDSSNR